MSQDSKSEDLKFYLEQVSESSKRSRRVLYLLLFSTALVFACHWKTRPGNWIESRIEVRSGIVGEWENGSTNALKEESIKELKDYFRTLDLTGRKWKELNARAAITNDDLYLWRERAGWERLQSLAPYLNRTNLQSKLADLEQKSNSWDSYTIPVLNVTFDYNDFIFFSALELSVLAIVLLYCLLREEQNLGISFKFAQGCRALPEFYEKASMEQIWSNPGWPVLKRFAYALFFIPVVIEWWTFCEDRTLAGKNWLFFDAGKRVLGAWDIMNHPLGAKMLVLETILILLLTVVLFYAGWIFYRMNERWQKAARDIRRNSTREGINCWQVFF